MDKDILQKKYGSLAQIGERVRAIRQRRGLTQSELADGEITRNMLSRIENGAALPSLPTLCAIAERLDIPVGALLGDLEDYVSRKLSDEIRGLLGRKNYAKAIELYDMSEQKEPGDDLANMLAAAHLGLAKGNYLRGKLSAALEQLEKAEALSSASHRPEAAIRDGVFLLRTMISDSSALRHDIAPPPENKKEHLRTIVFDNNGVAIYLYCKARLGDIPRTPYSEPHEDSRRMRSEIMPLIDGIANDVYRSHIDAKLCMVEADYLEAKAKLLPLVSKPELPPSLMYELYSDLELCCKCCGDFENAYKYSGMRLEILRRIT